MLCCFIGALALRVLPLLLTATFLVGVFEADFFVSIWAESERTESKTASSELSPFLVVLLVVEPPDGAASCFTARSKSCLNN